MLPRVRKATCRLCLSFVCYNGDSLTGMADGVVRYLGVLLISRAGTALQKKFQCIEDYSK
jgi:hypothetical protein